MKVSDMFAAWSDHRPVCRGEGALGKGSWPEGWAGHGGQRLAPGSPHSHSSSGLRFCIHLLINLHLFSTLSISRSIPG